MKNNKLPLEAFNHGYINLDVAKQKISKREKKQKTLAFKHGTLQIQIFQPQGGLRQLSRLQDCAYFVVQGMGEILSNKDRQKLTPGDFMFVAAGRIHGLIGLTPDFTVWDVSYGPDGGELRKANLLCPFEMFEN